MLSNTQQMICMSFHVVLVFIQFIVPSSSWLEFSAFVCHSHCTNIIRILILFVCLFFYLSECYLVLITSSSSTTLKFFCICLHFLFIFPVLVSVIITIYTSIWTHCVVSQFHLIFFIPIIIVTFQLCVVIVVKSS